MGAARRNDLYGFPHRNNHRPHVPVPVIIWRDLMAVSFTLNGKPTTLDVDPNMPLLWAIREAVGLTGTKFGCGVAQCGACTVHIEGQATRSCVTPVSAVEGHNALTIAGLSSKAASAGQAGWAKLAVRPGGDCRAVPTRYAQSAPLPNPHA